MRSIKILKNTLIENLTPEIKAITDMFYDIFFEYAKIQDESYAQAYDLSVDALVLSENYVTLQTMAGKLAATAAADKNSGNKLTKGDIQTYFYQQYRTLQYIHEHCRILWNRGEKQVGKSTQRNY